MSLGEILLLVLIGIGITNILVNSSILNNFRNFLSKKVKILGELVNCMLCSGFWIGIVIGISQGFSPIFLGALVSLFSSLFGRFLEYIDLVMAIQAQKIENGEEDESEEE